MRFSQFAFVATALAASATMASALIVATDLTGTWTYSVTTENGTGTPTVTMKQKGDSLSGTYESSRMGALPFKGTVKDKSFTFVVSTSGGTALTFTGTIIDADHVKGDADFSGQGGATFTGERRK